MVRLFHTSERCRSARSATAQDRVPEEPARKDVFPSAVSTVTRVPEQVTSGLSVPGTTMVRSDPAAGETTTESGTFFMYDGDTHPW